MRSPTVACETWLGLLTTSVSPPYCRGKAIPPYPAAISPASTALLRSSKCVILRPGDVLHANSEGVIRIPASVLGNLPAAYTAAMRSFEHEAHMMSRRTDISVANKKRLIEELVANYAIKTCIGPQTKIAQAKVSSREGGPRPAALRAHSPGLVPGR